MCPDRVESPGGLGGAMQRQGSFSQAEYAGKKKQTRRDRFLAEMEEVVPWARLVERLRSFYPKGERGRPPIGLERMLRIYFLQQWYGLADEALEDALYDSQALRGFAGIDLSVATVPDATTVLNFRHWLEEHDLTRTLFDEIGAMLEERGLLMRRGTIVDATIIAAPPSTKNKSKARDPEMHQTKKGNQWHFGMKAHIGVDVASGVVHTVVGTAANEADINQTAALLHGREEACAESTVGARNRTQVTRTITLKRVVEGLRSVIARAETRPRLRVRPEGRRRISVLQDALGPRAPFRASNQSTSGLFTGFFTGC